MEKPTAEEVAAQLRLPPDMVVLERPEVWPSKGEAFRLLATFRQEREGRWTVDVEPALPRGWRAEAVQWWDLGRAFLACQAHQGLRAVVVVERTARYMDVHTEAHRLLPAGAVVNTTSRGHVVWFGNGSSLRMVALNGAYAMRVLNGAEWHLALHDGLSDDGEAYLATRVRSDDTGLPVLGTHPLARPARQVRTW